MIFSIDKKLCTACGGCASLCPKLAIETNNSYAEILNERCIKCGICLRFCPLSAVIKEDK